MKMEKLLANPGGYLSPDKIAGFFDKILSRIPSTANKILLLPPDYTRKHSGAGLLTNILYQKLKGKRIDIMPALGTHEPMDEEKLIAMFGQDIPLDRFLVHNWRKDTIKVGEIPATFVRGITDGMIADSIPVKINKRIVTGDYDLIISIGQVLPHEVVGMSNYNKNILVGAGGLELINYSHYIGAIMGIENIMGRMNTPVRQLYDFAEENFLNDLPLLYILTVNSIEMMPGYNLTKLIGLFCGQNRRVYEEATKLSQAVNIKRLKKPLEKVIVYLDEKEFQSFWLGCKAIYRTRMAIADGGSLLILAPGLKKFGEDPVIDGLIRKYGYLGREKIRAAVAKNKDLQSNLSAAAHLIHGSTEGRFKATFACRYIEQREIEGVNFNYLSFEEAIQKYNPEELKKGKNIINDEEVYYIANPATGLWVSGDRFVR